MPQTPEQIDDKANSVANFLANEIWQDPAAFGSTLAARQKLQKVMDDLTNDFSMSEKSEVAKTVTERILSESTNVRSGRLGQVTDNRDYDAERQLGAQRLAAAAQAVHNDLGDPARLAGMIPEQELNNMGLSQGALTRALAEPSFMKDKVFAQADKRAMLTGGRELSDFEASRAGNMSAADKRMKMVDLVMGDRQLEVQKAMVEMVKSYNSTLGGFEPAKVAALTQARQDMAAVEQAMQPEIEQYKLDREKLYVGKLEDALKKELGASYSEAEYKAAAKAIHDSVIAEQDHSMQYFPTNDADADALCGNMARSAKQNLDNGYKYDRSPANPVLGPGKTGVHDMVYAARGAERNDLNNMNFKVMGRSEATTNGLIKEAEEKVKFEVKQIQGERAGGAKGSSVREAMLAQASKRSQSAKVDEHKPSVGIG